jgi:poly-gamma-glutamate synthesis protein (capsule biosynthesis protein)
VTRGPRILLVAGLVVALGVVLALGAILSDRDESTETAAGEPETTALRDEAAEPSDEADDVAATAATLDPDRPRRAFTLAATGDFLIHAPVQRRASANAGGTGHSFTPMLAEVAPIITAADLALCHMETPVSPDNTALSGYPLFNAPREIAADAASAGYDGCSTASNHSLDKGAAGVAATLGVLDEAGLGHAGTARSALEAVTPRIYDVEGVRVGHLSYSYGTNGLPLPPDKPWSVNLIDAGKILGDAAAASGAGAEFVIVSLQWGNEYQSAPTADQQALARQLLASPDIDLIVGSHVHVVQPIEKVGDEYVAYGVGNFLSNQGAPSTPTASQDGMILQVAVSEQDDGSFKASRVAYTPTWVDRSNYLIMLATPSRQPASHDRTVGAVTSLGPLAFDGTVTFEPIRPQ